MEKIEVEFRANFSRLSGAGGGEGVPFICGTTGKPSHFFGSILGPLICLQYRARICKPFKEHRNRFPAWRTGMTTLFDDRPSRLHKPEESIPWNRVLGSLNVYKFGLSTSDRDS